MNNQPNTSRISSFITKVQKAQETQKNTFKEQQQAEFVKKVKDEMSTMESDGGVFNSDKELACKYIFDKFTNYYLFAMKSYNEFCSKSTPEISEDILTIKFKDLMSHSFIVAYVCNDKSSRQFGQIKFNKIMYRSMFEKCSLAKLKKEFPGVEESKFNSPYYKIKYIDQHLNEFYKLAEKTADPEFECQDQVYTLCKERDLPNSCKNEWIDMCKSLSLKFI